MTPLHASLPVRRHLALAAQDTAFAETVLRYLHGIDVMPAFCRDFAALGQHLGPDTDGVLLLLLAAPTEHAALTALLQDISLQQIPTRTILLRAAGVAAPTDPDLLALLEARLTWPDDADELPDLLTRRTGHCQPFLSGGAESVEEMLARRLLAYTPSLLPLVERVALAAKHDVTVLLTGETGTGKTYFARLIHDYSPRRASRFLPVPCGAIAANLLESELFGHVKGAFTGADRTKPGKFAAVGDGTLLLDEIDTLGLEQQAALLRVLETGEFEPVGGVETEQCRARIVVASNTDLETAVQRGRFRADLYFRLNVMSFHLPPLRERVQDIAPLVRALAARFTRKFQKELLYISPHVLAALESFSWPGNVRQLENVMQHAVLMSSGRELQLRHLPEQVQEQSEHGGLPHAVSLSKLHQERDQSERVIIQRALANNGYNRSRAAHTLGISRVTLHKKMKKYGLTTIPIDPARAM